MRSLHLEKLALVGHVAPTLCCLGFGPVLAPRDAPGRSTDRARSTNRGALPAASRGVASRHFCPSHFGSGPRGLGSLKQQNHALRRPFPSEKPAR